MGKNTDIQWCDSTVNPVMGCAGCELWAAGRRTCYAGVLHQRRRGNPGFAPDFSSPKLFPGRMREAARWSDLTGQRRPDKPWLTGLPRLVFVSDMGDALSERGAIDPADEPVAGGAVPFEFLKHEIVDTALSPLGQRHRWLWLTKRPQRMAEFSSWLKENHGLGWPGNVWPGTSVTTRRTLSRIDHLGEVGDDQTIRFVSAEPLWEEVSLRDHLRGIAWVIVGGESRQGQQAEEFRCEWARRLRAECQEGRVAYFLKQLGSNCSAGGDRLRLKDGHGGDWMEWPEDLRVREVPLRPPPTRVPLVVLEDGSPGTSGEPIRAPSGAGRGPGCPAGGPARPAARGPLLHRLSELEPLPVEWLWDRRIPAGELTVVDGDPGVNKSSLLLDLAARVSAGREMPGGAPGVRAGVLLLLGEDSLRKTVIQRLREAGADLDRVAVPARAVEIPRDLRVLEESAAEVGAGLVVIDPLTAFLAWDASGEHKVRRALTPLREFAERTGVAVVLVRHLTKRGGRHPLYRGIGSVGIVAAARSALLVARSPEGPDLRVLCQTKSNLGPPAPSLLFEPVAGEGGVVRVEWRGGCDCTAEDLLAAPRPDTGMLAEAAGFLKRLLAGGARRQQEVKAEAVAAGLAYRTVERAREVLGVTSERRGWGPGSACYWRLPPGEAPPP